MFLSIDHPTQGTILKEVGKISHIVENAAGNVVVCLMNGETKIETAQTLDALFDQQNVTGYHLNMILVTNTRTGLREIWFTHSIMYIVDDPDTGGSKIVQRVRKDKLVVDESLATILAYQGASTDLGLISATVTKGGASNQFIFTTFHINEIVPSIPTNPASPAIIVLDHRGGEYPVTETVAAIQATMPT